MTPTRFVLREREDGVQEHNWYIDKLVKLIIKHDEKEGIRVEAPEQLYGMLCTDPTILQIWEGILMKDGLLTQEEIDNACQESYAG